MILDRILEAKRVEVAAAKTAMPEASLRATARYREPRRGFERHLEGEGRAIIAEIKKASPSRGVIRGDFRPEVHARQYEQNGARCLSVLTDGPFFQGSLHDLDEVRGAAAIPLLRKDFMIDPYQVSEARAHGADCILLIVAALEDGQMRELAGAASDADLDVLVEVHDEAELERALAAGFRLIGVNNRNLHTFETSLDVTRRLAALVGDEITLVSESGLRTAAELDGMEAIGVDAFLIGESFMKEDDPGAALARMLRSE